MLRRKHDTTTSLRLQLEGQVTLQRLDYRYWDSVTFLGWLSDEIDKVPHCRPVLEAAEAGTVVLVTTSALTIAEVLWPKGHEKIAATCQEDRDVLPA